MNILLSEAIISTSCFPEAAIVRIKDVSLKARTEKWSLDEFEIQRILQLFEHPTETREQGFTLGAVPYTSIRVDGSSIYGKRDDDALRMSLYGDTNPSNPLYPYSRIQKPSSELKPTTFDPNFISKNVILSYQDRYVSDREKMIISPPRATSPAPSFKVYSGIILLKTQSYLLLGIYDSHPGMAVEALERLADYFRHTKR